MTAPSLSPTGNAESVAQAARPDAPTLLQVGDRLAVTVVSWRPPGAGPAGDGELVLRVAAAAADAVTATPLMPSSALVPPPPNADRNLRYEQLLAAAAQCQRIAMGVVHPCSAEALEGAVCAARLGLVDAVLVGPESRIRSLAAEQGISLDGLRIVDVPHSHAAAAKAVEMARSGEVQALMKGSLHSDELLAEVVKADVGLRTARRISHVFVLDVPLYAKPLLVTDAAINVAPDCEAKADIVRNAIDLAHALGIACPKVAVLSAVETVNPKLRSAMDAAALSKMADRGQITGGLVDGPLAFDNAVSMAAAQTKGIHGPVAGDADILVVPDLESGNMLAKQLEYLGGAQSAGLVMGARVPIVLTSRADSAHSRIASCAIALLWARHRRGLQA